MQTETSQTQLRNIGKPLLIITGIWILYTILFLSLKSHGSQIEITKLTPFIGHTIVDLLALFYSIYLWKNASANSRLMFILLVLAFSCSIIDNTIYNLTYNFFQIPKSHAPFIFVTLDNIAFIGYLMFMLFAIIYVLPKNKIKNKLLVIVTSIIVLAFFAISFFTQLQTSDPFAYKFYGGLETFLDLTGFTAAILCLAVSKNKGLFFIILGHAVGRAIGLILDFNLFAQSYNIGSMIETLWIAERILMIYGLIYFKSNLSYQESPQNWVSAPNSIRAQSTFLAFLLSTGSLCLFYGVNHLFSAGKIFF